MLDGSAASAAQRPDYQTISTALHALVDALTKPRSTEKSSAVLGEKEESGAQPETGRARTPDEGSESKPGGTWTQRSGCTLTKARTRWWSLTRSCNPEIVARSANRATYTSRKNRNRWCGSWDRRPVRPPFTSYSGCAATAADRCSRRRSRTEWGWRSIDETAGAMIAQLKYGSGMPFERIEELEQRLGIPLPASTQWEIVEEVAELAKPALNELIRQAASGEIIPQ